MRVEGTDSIVGMPFAIEAIGMGNRTCISKSSCREGLPTGHGMVYRSGVYQSGKMLRRAIAASGHVLCRIVRVVASTKQQNRRRINHDWPLTV